MTSRPGLIADGVATDMQRGSLHLRNGVCDIDASIIYHAATRGMGLLWEYLGKPNHIRRCQDTVANYYLNLNL